MATPTQPPTPSNPSELQLFRVLQRANLLQYFETFISQGGDDVQQLCEAGEDEFLEIMALVGMASKPLHVRRLQKALQAWVVNPAAFEGNVRKSFPTHVHSMTGSTSQTIGHTPSQSISPSHSSTDLTALTDRSVPVPTSVQPQHPQQQLQDYKMTPPQSSTISTSTPWSSALSANQGGAASPSEHHSSGREQPSPTDSQEEEFKDLLFSPDASQAFSSGSGGSGLSSLGQPVLLEHQITAIATAAAMLAQELPPIEPKSLPKKQISREINMVMTMSSEDPMKMDAMRKYAAIYGRFDSKRKNDRPMSLHEISVNEAAAQLCSHLPALLTRREELFPLARQVVRDSGYQYSKGHSRAAEIVPKTEPAGDLSPESTLVSTPTPPPPPSSSSSSSSASAVPSSAVSSMDDKFTNTQNDLMDVTTNLSELAKEQERIRSALRVLLEAKDHTQMSALTAEMDTINDRYARMTTKRQDLVLQLALMSRHSSKLSLSGASFHLNNNNNQGLGSAGSLKTDEKLTINNSNSHDSDAIKPSTDSLNALYMAAALQNNPQTGTNGNGGSLIEEGLRIATQYGMSDFAQELMGMKSLQQSPSQGSDEANPDLSTTSDADKESNALQTSLENGFDLSTVKRERRKSSADKHKTKDRHLQRQKQRESDNPDTDSDNNNVKNGNYGKNCNNNSDNSLGDSGMIDAMLPTFLTTSSSPPSAFHNLHASSASSPSSSSSRTSSTSRGASSSFTASLKPSINIVSGVGFQQYVSSPTTTTQRLPTLDTMKLSTISRTIVMNKNNDNAHIDNSSDNIINNTVSKDNSNKKHCKTKSPVPSTSRVTDTGVVISSPSAQSSSSSLSSPSSELNVNNKNNYTSHNDNSNNENVDKMAEYVTLSIPAIDIGSDVKTHSATATTTINANNLTMTIKLNNNAHNQNNNNSSSNFDSGLSTALTPTATATTTSNSSSSVNVNKSPSPTSSSPSPSETTRRSSRKRTSEPDYYLINGGEKRFRPHSSRRSSSTSSERNL